jgi:hypothetical protein
MFDQINLKLKPSLLISAMMTTACLSAMMLIGSLNIPIASLLLLFLTLLGVNFYYVRLLGSHKSLSSITQIRLYKKELTLFDSQNQYFRAELSPNSFITPWLCILVFSSTTNNKTKIVLLCKQNIKNQDDFRRFRVWTKFGHTTQHNKTLIE